MYCVIPLSSMARSDHSIGFLEPYNPDAPRMWAPTPLGIRSSRLPPPHMMMGAQPIYPRHMGPRPPMAHHKPREPRPRYPASQVRPEMALLTAGFCHRHAIASSADSQDGW